MKTICKKNAICRLTGILVLFLLSCLEVAAKEKTPAFPGAEGFGRYTTGGRGGAVYHVTTLEDGTREGTFRWACNKSGTRTIVFDVSGTIHLNSALNISNGNLTIAGQTAPGDGICIADYPVSLKGRNIIVRYMRFRLGNKNVLKNGADGWDGFGGFDASDWMIDHCSVSWSIDECLSVLGNKNTTVQWCISAQSLVNSGHSKGAHGYGGNWGGNHASFHHNLIAHHTSRTPRLGPRPTTQMNEYMDMRNNVIYNFGSNGCYGGEAMKVNIVNNYYKPGPGSPTNDKGRRIAGLNIRTTSYVNSYPDYKPAWHIWGKYYVDGNYNSKYYDVNSDNWTYGIYNQIDNGSNDGTYTQTTKDTIKLNTPLDIIYTTTHTSIGAYSRVMKYVGASLHRDSHDSLMISDCQTGKASYTGSGLSAGFINSQDDLKPKNAGSDWSAWPTLKTLPAPTDSDKDGMPDEWETVHGLNPNDATDGAKVATEEGYTNLEVYMNSLVEEITIAQNESGTVVGGIEEVPDTPATEYLLDASTNTGNNTNSIYRFDNNITITNNNDKSYAVVSKTNLVKYSSNVQYTINLPAGINVNSIKFYGNANNDSSDGYLKELNGQTFSSEQYKFISRTAGINKEYTLPIIPQEGKITFTPSGTQVGWGITLIYENVKLGDANKDGKVNVNDIATIATYILTGKADSFSFANADVNRDGTINVNDISATANIILNNH